MMVRGKVVPMSEVINLALDLTKNYMSDQDVSKLSASEYASKFLKAQDEMFEVLNKYGERN